MPHGHRFSLHDGVIVKRIDQPACVRKQASHVAFLIKRYLTSARSTGQTTEQKRSRHLWPTVFRLDCVITDDARDVHRAYVEIDSPNVPPAVAPIHFVSVNMKRFNQADDRPTQVYHLEKL